MALIKCPECGRMVSTNAVKCPGCGAPIKELLARNTSVAPVEHPNIVNTVSKQPSNIGANNRASDIVDSQKKKRGLLWGLVAVIVLLLAVLAFLLFCDRNGSQPKQSDDVFIENSSRSDEISGDNNIKTSVPSVNDIQNTNIFPNNERIKNLLSDYSHAVENNDFSTLEKLYAPTVERYHSTYEKSRDYVVDDHRNYDDFFKVYGKHSSLRWETFKTERISDGRVETVIIEDYSLDRMDESKYSIFVLEKHFIINDDYQIVGVWDNQLSKKKKSDQY